VKPEFIDNREGNTLDAALRGHLDWLASTYARPIELAIATGYFNPQGFARIADQLERLPKVRLLLGAEPTPPPARPQRQPGDPKGERFDARLVRHALDLNAQGLRHDRDLLEFAPDVDAAVRRLLSSLASGKIEVRRYEKAFLHGKAFIFSDDEGVVSGSSNFTIAGLTTNLELNLGRYDPTPVRMVKKWFDDLWQEAVPYNLASVYAARYEEYPPYLIYLRVLWERYKDELQEEAGPGERIRLTTFQNDGIFRARRVMERYNGVLIADGVGLGKTFIAGEMIRQAVEERRQRVLLIAPAALRDGIWERFADRYQLHLEKVSYEELAADAQLGGDRSHLKQRANDYALIVIDEAQAFRNPDTQRARTLRRLLQGKPPKQAVLLTATPVNNTLWDLYYLLTYFVGHDAVFANLGIRSLNERFKEATAEDPYELRPDMLFDILDATTVRRTRHFVRRYYPHDRVVDLRGRETVVDFPEPHTIKVNYELDDVLPDFFGEFREALAAEEGEPDLTLARYWPSRYSIGVEANPREVALVGLLRSCLLKRFESSAHAFARTAEKMAQSHDAFLAALDRGFIATPEAIEEWEATDSDETFEELLREGGAVSTEGYDVERLRADVEHDRDLLRSFAEKAGKVTRQNDPKLAGLVDELMKIAKQAEREALGDEDFRNKRKVVVFSYFADTADWIEEHLRDVTARDRRLACYRGRIAAVSGEEYHGGIARADAVFGFVPESSEAPPGRDEDRFDILVTTDVLAEGTNLQQCRNVINYDLPWNPMRLVQRHGRVDRIGSLHRDVYVRCFFPDRRLEELLDLEARIRRKIAQAAASIGVESEVIPGSVTSEIVFAETREEIEALRRENATLFVNAGEDPTAHSGEEYRQELRKGLERYGDQIKNLPWAAGSGFAGGRKRGHFFCARVGERIFFRFVPAHETEIVRDSLRCLSLITCSEDTERYVAPDLAERAYGAWEKARGDIHEEWMVATDPANFQPKVRPLFQKAAEHLRKHPPRALRQTELDTVLDSLEAPWGVRIEKAIREVFDPDAGDPYEVSKALVEKVRELGLQPFVAPTPLPVIDQDEIALVCWMAVESNSKRMG
jgi:hypothetical protein